MRRFLGLAVLGITGLLAAGVSAQAPKPAATARVRAKQ